MTSDYVKIERLPKATFHGNDEEREFYAEFFKNSRAWMLSTSPAQSWLAQRN